MSLRTRISGWTDSALAGVGLVRRSSVQGYAGGTRSRKHYDFMPPSSGVNVIAEQHLDLLVRRVRSLVRDNPHLRNALLTVLDNAVDTGIFLLPNTGDIDTDKELKLRWSEFAERVDPSRRFGQAASQRSFIRELWCGGEAMPLFGYAEPIAGYKGGPCVQIVARERVPMDQGVFSTSRPLGENTIRHGVELDRLQRPVAYHVTDTDPSDAFTAAVRTRRIGREDGTLCFFEEREGQLRGVPWPVAGVEVASDEDAFQEAYLLLARLAASISPIITGMSPPKNATPGKGGDVIRDANGKPIEYMEPGRLGYAPAGVDVKVPAANLPSPTMAQAIEVMLRRLSASLHISYEALSKDYSKTTYASSRQSQLEDRRGYRHLQAMVICHHDIPLYRRWLQFEVALGSLTLNAKARALYEGDPSAFFKVSAIAPGWEWVDPLKEAQAMDAELQMGVLSPQQACAALGRDWHDVTQQRLTAEKLEADMRAKMGLPPAAPRQPLRTATADGASDPDQDQGQDKGQDSGQGSSQDGSRHNAQLRGRVA